MDLETALKNMRLFAKEVMPEIKEYERTCTTVPFSMVGPETVTIRAFVIAYDCALADTVKRPVAANATKASLSFITVNAD